MQEQICLIFFVFISMQDHTVEKWLVFVPYCKKVTSSIPSLVKVTAGFSYGQKIPGFVVTQSWWVSVSVTVIGW